MSVYRPLYVAWYRQLGSNLDIHSWTEIVGKRLDMFKDESQIYNPAAIRIQMTKDITDPEGVMQLDVPVYENGWYPKLVREVGKMINARGTVDITDEEGKSIADARFVDLARFGDLRVVDKISGKQLFVDKVMPPPRYMASDKHQDVFEWFQDARHDLCNVIVEQLVGKDVSTIVPAVTKDGPVQQAIEKFVNTPKWAQFCQTYARDDTVRQLDPNMVAKQIAYSVLHELRTALKANEKQITAFHANKVTDNLWEEDKRVIGEKVDYKSDVEMFEDITESALHQPDLERKVYYIISAGVNVGCHLDKTKKKKEKEKKTRRVENDIKDHPLDRYYHGHHYKRFGKLPGHIVSSLNQRVIGEEKEKKRPYPGDPVKAVAMFHLFSGRHQLPEIKTSISSPPPLTRLIEHRLVPIERKHILRPLPVESASSGPPPLISADMPALTLIEDLFESEAELDSEDEDFFKNMPRM